jgi:hypothetical protein
MRDEKLRDSELIGSKHSQIKSAYKYLVNIIIMNYYPSRLFELCNIYKWYINCFYYDFVLQSVDVAITYTKFCLRLLLGIKEIQI